MVDTPAFLSEVTAYPAITVITQEKSGPTRIAHRPTINVEVLRTLAQVMRDEKEPKSDIVKEMAGVVQGNAPWILESSDQIAIVRRLEHDFPILEDAGCRVGIGVATGADKVFIKRRSQHHAPRTHHETRVKLDEAHTMLSDIYNWFTEGFDTKDLQEAKALLHTLHD